MIFLEQFWWARMVVGPCWPIAVGFRPMKHKKMTTENKIRMTKWFKPSIFDWKQYKEIDNYHIIRNTFFLMRNVWTNTPI